MLGLRISDSEKKDTKDPDEDPTPSPRQCGGVGGLPIPRGKASPFRGLGSVRPGASAGRDGPFPQPMPGRPCGALVFAALLTPPGSLASSSEGPQAPLVVEAAWVERVVGERRGPGPLFRKEGTDFSSGSGASRSPRLPAPRLPEQTLSTLFGDRETTLHVCPWKSQRGTPDARGGGTFTAILHDSLLHQGSP